MSTGQGKVKETLFVSVAVLAMLLALGVLLVLLLRVGLDGVARLDWGFLTSFPSRFAHKAGILSALVGSLYLIVLCSLIAVPVGVGAAIYLEEYAPSNRLTRIIEVNIANLAGVPSVIYGLLGLQVFARYLKFDRSLISGSATLALLVLPVIIIAAREAIRAVPRSLREGAYALGSTRWQMVRTQVLPVAMPGILTGCILAVSRALGETAPLVTLGALTYVAFVPDGLLSPFSALPIQIFNWTSRPQPAFHNNAAAGILVLLILLLLMNSTAIWLRMRLQKRLK